MDAVQFSTVASHNSRTLAGKSNKFVSSWTGSSTAFSLSSRNLFTVSLPIVSDQAIGVGLIQGVKPDQQLVKGLQDHKFGDKQPGKSQRRINFVEMLDEDTSYPWDCMEDNMQEDHHDGGETLPDKGRCVEPNLVDNGRWGEEYHDQLNDNSVEHGREKFSQRKFTRFDHRHADDIIRTVRSEGKLERYGTRSRGKLQSTFG
ncbi:hypothetical protein Q3G72_017229 [Acer saccharum]|nr:hypothetical protein Q3G72_017229 [Acer saccharum]